MNSFDSHSGFLNVSSETSSPGFLGTPQFGCPEYIDNGYPMPEHYHHAAEVCQGGFCIRGLEKEILKHRGAITQYDAVSLCLRLPIVLLQSLYQLRCDGDWHSELSSVYSNLFTTPSPDLFNLISTLRLFPQYDPSGLLHQLSIIKDSVTNTPRPRSEIGRTAPEGFVYICPSAKCKKPFRKSGHATNHLKNWHPEYLELHPDYEPQQSLMPISRSGSTSPRTDRRSPRRSQERRTVKANESTPSRSPALDMQPMCLSEEDMGHASPQYGSEMQYHDEGDGMALTWTASNTGLSPEQQPNSQLYDYSSGINLQVVSNHLSPYTSASIKRHRPTGSSGDLLSASGDHRGRHIKCLSASYPNS